MKQRDIFIIKTKCDKVIFMSELKKHSETKETDLQFGNLGFEEVLDGLMQIKPVDNQELKQPQPKPKQKSESVSKKKKTR